MKLQKKISKNLFYMLIFAAIIFVLISLLDILGSFSWIENKTYDSRMKFSSKFLKPSEEISIILLDQESLDWAKEELNWSWPWPRESYAKIVDYFTRANANSVAFDMIYSEPSIYGKEDDEKFAQSSKNFGKVVQTVFYENENSTAGTLPIPILKESCAKLGNVTSNLDSDRVARLQRVIPKENQSELSLALASYSLSFDDFDLSSILQDIPLQKGDSMYIRYVDDISKFIPYSAKQILQSEFLIEKCLKEGLDENDFSVTLEDDDDYIPFEQFENNFVFFALYAPGLFDICATPVSSTYPGVGVHLCQLNSILQEKYLRKMPVAVDIFLILIFVFVSFLLAKSISQAKARSLIAKTVLILGICILYIFLTYALFICGIILPVFQIVLAAILTYIVIIFHLYMTEGKQKRYIKNAFKQYLSPTVIENLIENPQMLNLGGEEREITAFFSDVQGFTSISEKLSPKELTDLLNTYLSAMTDIILANGGTIDKYEGDAIIAFWGAPTYQENHSYLAIKAAIECQEKLKQMQNELTTITKVPFIQRIGLNTGKAVVGNMGSTSRFDYTMLGDSVNLASRLEGINKQFGTYTLVSEDTMNNAKKFCQDNFLFRYVAEISVVGKENSVKVYVPMKKDEYQSNSLLYKNYENSYNLFTQGEFEKAKENFEKLEDDEPAKKLSLLCSNFVLNPPKNWNGVIKLNEK